MGIILASASPRRKELLHLMGLDFDVRTASHDETMNPFANPADEVERVSRLKAQAVYPLCNDDDIIIAADTIVVCDGLVMGKPRSDSDAFSMLRRLAGREHQVMTGLSIMKGEELESTCVVTTLRFRPMSDEEIRAYVSTGEPMGKAGGYAIQGMAATFTVGIDGDYYNVMGLPVCTLTVMLRRHGVKILGC